MLGYCFILYRPSLVERYELDGNEEKEDFFCPVPLGFCTVVQLIFWTEKVFKR